MKKRLFAAIVVMACLAVSCQKNEDELPTFEARTESGSAKTELVGSIIQWVSGDQVKVFGDFGYAIYNVTPRSGEPTWATLTPSENHGLTGLLPYRFVYPASMASGGATTSDNNNTLYVDYPRERSFSDVPLKYFAMYGQSSNNDVTFMNLGGMMKIHLDADTHLIKSVIVSADEDMSGRYSIVPGNTNNPLNGGERKEVFIHMYNRDISSGCDLYVAMPAGEYHSMKIAIVEENDDTCVRACSSTVIIRRSVIVTTNISNMVFDRRYIPYTINGVSYPIPGLVDLGLPSGTLWADRNIGAVTVMDTGLYLGWADPTGEYGFGDYPYMGVDNWNNIASYFPNYYWGVWTSELFGGTNPPRNIQGTDLDIAKAKLGQNWCVPSAADFQELTDYCTFVDSGSYYKVTGSNGNHIKMVKSGIYIFSVNSNGGGTPIGYTREMEYSSCFWASTITYDDDADEQYHSTYNHPAADYAHCSQRGFDGAAGTCDRWYRNGMIPIRAVYKSNK